MITIGIIGLGVMGKTHLDVYSRRQDVQVMAAAGRFRQSDAEMSSQGNIRGQPLKDFGDQSIKRFADPMKLIADPAIDVVDICSITPLHLPYARAAMKAGKHVLIEKPLARTYADALELASLAERSTGISMCAMCMRFWPAWEWLKNAIDSEQYGRVLSAQFRRVSAHPHGAFYADGEANGGAALDLHLHDADFIQHCFGMPDRVQSFGYSRSTNAVDHLVTKYHYPDVPIVTAEGGWDMTSGFAFRMQYTVNFQRATASFDLDASPELVLCERDQPPRAVEVPAGLGYEREIGYFIDCIKAGRRPDRVTLQEAAGAIAIIEAEVRSVRSGRPEKIEINGFSRKGEPQ